MKIISQISDARALLKQGEIIAYPTEAVYGLGCDPFNQQAVATLLSLKQRAISKGLILLIADWSQLKDLVAAVTDALLVPVRATWPGPVTWIFPPASTIPAWLTGQHDGIAIRMSAHPIAHQLCLDGPVVSTSANVSGFDPAMNLSELGVQFPEGIDAVLTGNLGGLTKTSAIFDVRTGVRLR